MSLINPIQNTRLSNKEHLILKFSKMKGTVKWYKKDKGYGFITGEDNKDYFVHYTSLPEDTDNIEGDTVEFEVKKTDRGVQAVDIKFIDAEQQTEETA